MTNLIETFAYKWVIDHDKTPGVSKAYGGTYDAIKMLAWVQEQFGPPPVLGTKGKNGSIDFGNGISLTWDFTGLEEVPEETGGDN